MTNPRNASVSNSTPQMAQDTLFAQVKQQMTNTQKQLDESDIQFQKAYKE